MFRPLALFALACGALSTIADPDLWGHIRFGLDILETGHVVTGVDRYSFTADHPFLYHEWLGGTLFATAFRAAGPVGIQILKALLAMAPGVLTWYVLRRTAFTWRWAGVALVSVGTLAIAFTARPQLATVIVLLLVGRILTSQSSLYLWFLPPLFALWANLHGGWIVGGAMVALWTADAWIRQTPQRYRLLAVGAASLLLTLVNPYGIGLWQFLLETVRLERGDISEWRPIWKAGGGFAVMWTVSVITIAISLRKFPRPPIVALVTLVGFAYAAARVNRLVPLFAVMVVALMSRHWPRESAPQKDSVGRAILDGCAVAICLSLAFWFGGIEPCISMKHDVTPDPVAGEALRGARGRLVTHFDWGEYALWHFGPALQVSIDGRRETVYRSKTIREQQAIADGTDIGLRALERIRPDYVWLPANSKKTADWLTSHDYRIDVTTERSFVARRADLAPLSPWAGTPSGCFPGP